MERDTKVIGCPISEADRKALDIDENTAFDAFYADGKIIIQIVDDEEFEPVDLDGEETDWDVAYALGHIAGQNEGYKEGYREGYKDGVQSNVSSCHVCHCKAEDNGKEY